MELGVCLFLNAPNRFPSPDGTSGKAALAWRPVVLRSTNTRVEVVGTVLQLPGTRRWYNQHEW
jgi:hypothetical protein